MTVPEAKPGTAEPPKKSLTAREKARRNQVKANDPLVGQVIGGHYEVLECIGKGGMSIVYKTRHQLINQFRAVKVLLPHREGESDCLLRFQVEATAASRLDNKHIVRVHDFVAPEASAPYLVMDYVCGQALGDEIDILGRLPIKRSLNIFVQILEAIGHTHARGVIHRDLKPDNILLVDDPVEGPDFVKLIDFGIAKLTAADKLQPQGLTPTGEVFGSPQYMSPEQCAGLPLDVRSEIYSLGCILYEMLSGRAPLLGKSVLETLNMQAHTEAPKLSSLPIEPPLKMPRGLEEIVAKCLAKKPDDRFQSTEELAKAMTKLPSFDRRRQLNNKIVPIPGSVVITLGIVALVLGFTLGYGSAKMMPIPANILTVKETAAVDEKAAAATGAEYAPWQTLYVDGQKALDAGDLTGAATKLEDALTKANSLNDGQKRAAATGMDLAALALIKQFKNCPPNQEPAQVSLPQEYPNNPWETKIAALADVLRSNPQNAEEEKAIFRSTVALLEDTHKGSLTSLNGLMKLAEDKIEIYNGVSPRDKMRLILLITGIREEQGFTDRAKKELAKHAAQLTALGEFDTQTAKFHLLSSRLDLAENDLKTALDEAKKAQTIYEENTIEHTADLADISLLRSDIALLDKDNEQSLRLAKQALASLEMLPPSERLDLQKDKVLTRLALLDPANSLLNAQTQLASDLDREELQAPKEVAHLITALYLSQFLDRIKSSNDVSAATANGTNTSVGAAAGARAKLWRAMALAYISGRLGQASNEMQPLMASYDTPLTKKELLKLATNRLAIDESLAATGNVNGPDLMEDNVVLGETFEDFSLGPIRNLKKSKMFMDKATGLLASDENRINHLVQARFFFYQAKNLRDQKLAPGSVESLARRAAQEIERAEHSGLSVDGQMESAALSKKIQTMQQDAGRAKTN